MRRRLPCQTYHAQPPRAGPRRQPLRRVVPRSLEMVPVEREKPRELQRLENIAETPVFSGCAACLDGRPALREVLKQIPLEPPPESVGVILESKLGLRVATLARQGEQTAAWQQVIGHKKRAG